MGTKHEVAISIAGNFICSVTGTPSLLRIIGHLIDWEKENLIKDDDINANHINPSCCQLPVVWESSLFL